MNALAKLAGALCVALVPFVPANAATFTENFSSPPAARGWSVFGNTNLFQWDGTNQNLRITWDSSQTNSYFYYPLRTILSRSDLIAFNVNLRIRRCRSNA